MLRRSRSIMQYTTNTLTCKIKAAVSRWAGEIMMLMFLFFYVLCWVCGIVHLS
jgi:hypothetical protein